MRQDPTKEQIKGFWEWCGLRRVFIDTLGGVYYHVKDEDSIRAAPVPIVDLNNIYRYAVPKLTRQGYHFRTDTYAKDVNEVQGKCSWVEISKDGKPVVTYAKGELVDALFWAIYEVIDNPEQPTEEEHGRPKTE